MSIRISVMTLAAAALATAMLSACGSATTPAASKPASSSTASSAPTSAPSSPSGSGSSPSKPSPVPPVAGAPMIRVVNLNTTFSPDAITLAAGMKFQVIVSPSIEAGGLSFPSSCGTAAQQDNGGMLSVACPSTGSYMFTAERAGTTTLSATVRPRCSQGEMCPQWIKDAAMTVTITG